MSCNIKTIKVYRGYATGFNGEPLLNVSFVSQITITGWGAKFIVGNITKSFQNIQSGFSVNLTAQETATLPIGLNNGSLVLIDSNGNERPVATDLPILVSDWVEGDIELDGFEYTATLTIEENDLTINIQSASPSGAVEEIVNQKISEHNSSTTAHQDIRGLVSSEATVRQSADTTLTNNLNTEIATRENADNVLSTAISGKASINDSSTSSQTETWSANKLNTVIGNVESLILAL